MPFIPPESAYDLGLDSNGKDPRQVQTLSVRFDLDQLEVIPVRHER
jgi:hypothetical protein